MLIKLKKPWETEIENILARGIRAIPTQSNGKLLYVIHPESNTYDGDPSEVAKYGINSAIEHAATQGERTILVYPTSVGVYIDPKLITDIRKGDNESNWVYNDDFCNVTEVTLVGGKLRKCLGITYENIISLFMHNSELTEAKNPELNVVLPLESIYTESGCTAKEEFLAGISTVGEKASLGALLCGINPERTYYNKSSLEYGFIHPRTNQTINLHLNGERVHTLRGKKIDHLLIDDELHPAEPDMMKIQCNLPPLDLPETTINLNVLYDESKKSDKPVNPKLADSVTNRWNYIKKINPATYNSFTAV